MRTTLPAVLTAVVFGSLCNIALLLSIVLYTHVAHWFGITVPVQMMVGIALGGGALISAQAYWTAEDALQDVMSGWYTI